MRRAHAQSHPWLETGAGLLLALLLVTAPAVPAVDRPTERQAERQDERHVEPEAGPARPRRPFGVTFVTDADAYQSPTVFAASHETIPPRVVLLVHGLDDPGWMWRDVIPALRERGHVVSRMEYPNDGPIAESADMLAMNLIALRRLGVERVDVVAHSMGGLVTRDVLTRRAYYDGDGAGGGGAMFPAVGRLIMCGTPNHGSNVVRLRAISEAKEHISRAFTGEGNWFGGLSDGSGEAAIDLLPKSEFLRRLNARGQAENVEYTIIAGRMSPVTEGDLSQITENVKRAARSAQAPKWLRDWLGTVDEQATDFLDETVRGLGDGCVTLDSARLDGVEDFVEVEANHVSMIVRVIPAVEDTPAGIPIILDRLDRLDRKPAVADDETRATPPPNH